MTEQEYINVQELTLIREAINTLGKIIPANSLVVPSSGLSDMRNQLHKWEVRLNDEIEIKHVPPKLS